jgi:nicotinate-nucleotide pyrophosphorylase (carboxylating)
MQAVIDLSKEHSDIVRIALEEDVGTGDITTGAVIPAGMKSKAFIRAGEDMVVCGLNIAEVVFRSLDRNVAFRKAVSDGQKVRKGDLLAEVRGDARALLTGERTALNFLQRMSGIATMTSRFAIEIRGTGVRLLDTRKTTPGMRALEKYAVVCGGGHNHRSGLYDAILVKDNHIRLVGLEDAVAKAKKTGGKVEVEVVSVDEARRAVDAGADIIMLDNMPLGEIAKALKVIGKGAIVEVSGGVNEKNIGKIAKLGVDWISVGALTHSPRSVNINMEIFRISKAP